MKTVANGIKKTKEVIKFVIRINLTWSIFWFLGLNGQVSVELGMRWFSFKYWFFLNICSDCHETTIGNRKYTFFFVNWFTKFVVYASGWRDTGKPAILLVTGFHLYFSIGQIHRILFRIFLFCLFLTYVGNSIYYIQSGDN